MKLYKISQDANDGYDTYDSFVVAAKTASEAKGTYLFGSTWAKSIPEVAVEYLGTAKAGTKKGVVLGSFNAG